MTKIQKFLLICDRRSACSIGSVPLVELKNARTLYVIAVGLNMYWSTRAPSASKTSVTSAKIIQKKSAANVILRSRSDWRVVICVATSRHSRYEKGPDSPEWCLSARSTLTGRGDLKRTLDAELPPSNSKKRTKLSLTRSRIRRIR